MTNDFRYTIRKLVRSPFFTTVSLVTLAVGIGANTAIFSVVNGVLLKPLPFEDPDRLVGVWHTAPGAGFDEVNQSFATYLTYRDDGRVFEDIGLWDQGSSAVTGAGEPEQVVIMRVTDGTMPILGIRPALGRAFTAEDDSPTSPETVILAHGYWQRRFGADPQVLGKTITIDGRPRAVIGVMPEELKFLRFDPAVYLPFRIDRSKVQSGNFSFQGVARLRDGVTLADANADIARLLPVAFERYAGPVTLSMMRDAQFGPLVRPLAEDVVGDVGKVLWVLLGTVGLVLLIACANVANLFLVRAEARRVEVAIRTALGADRRWIAREFLSETLTLGLAAGAAGLVLAYAGVRLLVAIGPTSLPRLNEISIDTESLLFTLAISLVAGLLFGLFPVIRYGRSELAPALRESGRGGSAGRERHRARNALVVAQVALALVLLVGSGLMIRSFQALRKVEPGFERPEEVLTMRVSIPPAEVEDPVATATAYEQIHQRISAIPGVSSAGLSSSITMDGNDSNDATYVEDFPTPEGQVPPIRRFKAIGEGYFETLQNHVLAGRTIRWSDIHTRAKIVVVTENFAREYWKTAEGALGKRIRNDTDGPWWQIVGVVGNAYDDGVSQPAPPIVYWPLLMEDFYGAEVFTYRSAGFVIRSSRVGSEEFMAQVRDAVWSVNPRLPLANVQTLDELLDRSMARTAFALVMLAIAAGIALLLGTVGIYGVISYVVAQRTREIGVRMALGANAWDVRRLVLKHGLALAAIGVTFGLVASFALSRLMSAILFGVEPVDVLTYAVVATTLAAIAVLASYLPARRATRVPPGAALRWE